MKKEFSGEFDVVVVGGGVTGTAILRRLSACEGRFALIEAENDVGTAASCANSGIVHAGYDCRPGSLMAGLNVAGNAMFEELCKELAVPFKRTGSLVVSGEEGREELERLLRQGEENGVPDLSIVEDPELHRLEPNLSPAMTVGLLAKTAGVTASYELSVALAQSAIVNGAEVFLEFPAREIRREQGKYVVSDGKRYLTAKTIVNAAGANFNEINRLAGAEEYPVSYRRGEYCVLDKSETRLVSRVIFPLPTPAGKGILVLPTTGGNIMLGPTSEPASDDLPVTTAGGMERVKSKTRGLVEGINLKKIIKIFAGVRTVSGEDFVIRISDKIPDYVTVGGICSPGLTSSPAIAETVADMIPGLVKKAGWKRVTSVPNPGTEKELNALIAADPDYGQLMCKCEKVSLGQIKYVLEKLPLPPRDLDALKRRLRVTMGRCQGSFCSPALIDLLRRRNGGRNA